MYMYMHMYMFYNWEHAPLHSSECILGNGPWDMGEHTSLVSVVFGVDGYVRMRWTCARARADCCPLTRAFSFEFAEKRLMVKTLFFTHSQLVCRPYIDQPPE